MTDFVTKALKGCRVDILCSGTEKFHGTIHECMDGIVHLRAETGDIMINMEKILSVTRHEVA